MAPATALAFLRTEDGLDLAPADCEVVPLRPGLSIPASRRVVDRPEDLLEPHDRAAIERAANGIVSGWRPQILSQRLTWQGVDLTVCLDDDLRLVGLDLAKTALIVEHATARAPSAMLVTDVPPMRSSLPAYPYLNSIGSLLEQVAAERSCPFRNLAPTVAASSPKQKLQGVARAYTTVASRKGATRLRGGHPLVAIGPYRDFYQPVARAWRARGGATVVLSPSRLPIRAAPKEGLYLASPEGCLNREDRAGVHDFVGRSTVELDFDPPSEVARVGGVNIAGPLRTHLAVRLREWLPDLAAVGMAFAHGLDRASALVLLETVSPFSQACVRYAQKAGIHTTVLQHGVIAEPFSYRLLAADKVAAWGSLDAKWFTRALPASVRVEPTGSPRYDLLAKESQRRARDPLPDLAQEVPIVLFAVQPFVQGSAERSPWEHASVIEMVLEAGRKIQGCRILVKWHPSQPPERLSAPEDDLLARKIHHIDALALLRRASVVLAVSSTVALEAMYLRRPVVFLGSPEPESPFHPPEDGGGVRARTERELVAELDTLVRDRNYRHRVLEEQDRYLSRTYRPLDGGAAERVVDLLGSH